jgi:hypothetical protein
MNFSMGDLADALQLKPTGAAAASSPAAAQAADEGKHAREGDEEAATPLGSGVVDPLQWWGALTQQFQEIAAGAMNEAAARTAVDSGGKTGARAGGAARKSPRKRPSKKAAG